MQKRLNNQELLEELQSIEAAKKTPEKFGVLYEKYYRQMFMFVYKRIGEEEMTGDVVAQVFVKAMVNLPKYQYKGVPFSAWLYRIASNEVNQHFRDQKNQRCVSMEKKDIERMFRDVKDEGGDEDTEMLIRVMTETLKELPPDDVQLIELRFFEKKSFQEVGFIMGITENNAKVKAYRILERMKKKMDKKLAGKHGE